MRYSDDFQHRLNAYNSLAKQLQLLDLIPADIPAMVVLNDCLANFSIVQVHQVLL